MKKQVIFLLFMAGIFVSSPLFATFDSAQFNKARSLNISRITPKGNDVPAGRQIVIQFNQPVVPLGRMERKKSEIPITISPNLKGQWRWLNTSALAYQLDEKNALIYATKYSVEIKPGIKTETGKTLKKKLLHRFITQRPKVQYTSFVTWKAPGLPVIRVTFNQPVIKRSVEKYLYFNAGKRSGKRVNAIVEPPQNRYHTSVTKQGKEYRDTWVLSPAREIAVDTDVSLWVEKGLQSVHGPETGISSRSLITFQTFPEFKFLGVSCYTNDLNAMKMITPGDTKTRANPLEYQALVFSAPVTVDEVKENLTFTPDLAGGRTDYDPWSNSYRFSKLRSSHTRGREYRVRFPEALKAYQQYRITEKASSLKDAFGRRAVNAIDMTFFTDHRKPDYTILHQTSVLEEKVDTEAPLVVTNVKQVDIKGKILTLEKGSDRFAVTRNFSEAEDIAYAVPMGIRTMLKGKTGAVYGTVNTVPYIKKYNRDRNFFSQVTPFQIHVKAGHFNYSVWVTDLATGKPVDGASVTIYKDRINSLKHLVEVQAKARTSKDGIAMLPGNETLDPNLAMYSWSYDDDRERFFVKVVKDGKMGVLPIDSRFEIDTWRVSNAAISSNVYKKYGHIHTWGTTAQGIYKAGDTIQYKFYVRNQDNNTLTIPPLKRYRLNIVDPTGKTVEQIKNLTLSEFGAYDGEYTLSKKAAVGWYSFELHSSTAKGTWIPMNVLVSDFTPSPFRVTSELNGDLFTDGDRVSVSTSARLHAGGPYTDATTRIVGRLSKRTFSSNESRLKDFYFQNNAHVSRPVTLFQKTLRLNEKGDLSSHFELNNPDIIYGRLTVESSVQDDRGKYVASAVSADYCGRDRFVGLKPDKWLYYAGKKVTFRYVVVDKKGKPVKGTKVNIRAEHKKTKASRVKGAGNAYLTHYVQEWVKTDDATVVSGKKPDKYSFVPKEPGSYRIIAEINDTKGRKHITEMWTWVVGKGRVVWEQPDDNSLQIIPEQETYAVGDKARYLVKNPYPGAYALISIERYGVIKQWVQRLKKSTSVVKFKVEPDFMPGFYLSVVVMSPRVAKPLGAGNVDLGKPAMKVGYVPVQVNDPYKMIKVRVKTDKKKYKPGDKVTVSIKAKPSHRSKKKEPIELAVAVLDEAVFDLLKNGKNHYDPYNGFYKVDGLDLVNYNLLLKLVGRQKYEEKGANTGGGGGFDVKMRSVFKYVSYWNPSIKADKKGRATIEFTVPDNLTGWRVFAMAVTPSDRMGLGDKGFKVNRPTEIRPVMPNQVTEGDQFIAGFSVMNRTEKSRTLDVTIKAKGSLDLTGKKSSGAASIHKRLDLKPYKRTTVFLPVKAGKHGNLTFSAVGKDRHDGDGVVHHVPVQKRRSLETAATYGTTLLNTIEEHVQVPKTIHTDVGDIGVVLSPSVIGNIEGAFEYMKEYPYACWEQKLTKAVMASHYINLRDYLSKAFKWDDAKEIVNATLAIADNYQTPSGGMSYYTPQDTYVSPYLSAYTALAFNWVRKSGYRVPETVESKLHNYLSTMLKKDVLPDFYSKGMASTVRAVALAALADHGKISSSDLTRYKPHIKQMSLFGKAMFMQAAIRINGGKSIAKTVCHSILGHSNQSGGSFVFSEKRDSGYERILSSDIRSNAAILSVFTEYGETQQGKALVGDVPFKLVRYITQTRGKRDRWENTQENVFCMNALTTYSRIYESKKPAFTIDAYVDDKQIGKTGFTDLKDDAVMLKRKLTAKDPGKGRKINIKKKGDGRLYYSARIRFAPLEEHAERINAGIDIRKEMSVNRNGSWELLKQPFTIKRGELVRVDIYVSLPAARNYVVVDDPVPGGLEPVNRDLATASIVDSDEGRYKASEGSWWFHFSDWYHYSFSRWSFYHKELRHDAVRFYSDWLNAGNYHLSYTAQAIAEGEFAAMPVHAEEMYDPDVFGKGLPGTVNVNQAH